MKWYLKAFKQYFDFKGRARRKEYWMFLLFNWIVMFVLAAMSGDVETVADAGPMFYVFALYFLVMIIPAIALQVRRLHDLGKSGWMILINFIPLIGGIWMFVLNVQDSQHGTNQYGPNPKMVADEIGDIGRE